MLHTAPLLIIKRNWPENGGAFTSTPTIATFYAVLKVDYVCA